MFSSAKNAGFVCLFVFRILLLKHRFIFSMAVRRNNFLLLQVSILSWNARLANLQVQFVFCRKASIPQCFSQLLPQSLGITPKINQSSPCRFDFN